LISAKHVGAGCCPTKANGHCCLIIGRVENFSDFWRFLCHFQAAFNFL
jgi:hypothetical protein